MSIHDINTKDRIRYAAGELIDEAIGTYAVTNGQGYRSPNYFAKLNKVARKWQVHSFALDAQVSLMVRP